MAATPWNESDIDNILKRYEGSPKLFLKERTRYPGLVCQTKTVKIQHTYYRLIFDRSDGRVFTPAQLRLLLGPHHRDIEQKYRSTATRTPDTLKVLDRNGFTYDFANVSLEHRLSPQFNILSQQKGIKAYSESSEYRPAEIPAAIILAISLTHAACQSSERGLVYWQPKERKHGMAQPWWNRVPDVMYSDLLWTPELRDWFKQASHKEQGAFTCASTSVKQHIDVILPFVVDFEGLPREDSDDARVSADIDRQGVPKAAISVPGSAFVGWYSQMTPDLKDKRSVQECYRAASEGLPCQWVLSESHREATRKTSLLDMLQTIQGMYCDASISCDGVTCYATIMTLVEQAEEKDQQQRKGSRVVDLRRSRSFDRSSSDDESMDETADDNVESVDIEH